MSDLTEQTAQQLMGALQRVLDALPAGANSSRPTPPPDAVAPSTLHHRQLQVSQEQPPHQRPALPMPSVAGGSTGTGTPTATRQIAARR